MAHDCPDCGALCYCGGDIDDIHWGEDSEESDACTHCLGAEDGGEDEPEEEEEPA